MFVGHLALGLTAKKFAGRASIGTYFIGAQFLDLLWPILLLLDLEHVNISPGITALTPLDFYDYPISHGLISVLTMSFVGGIICFLLSKQFKESLVFGLLISSHWFLDFLVHRPDLPVLWRGGPLLGLGLWNFPVIAILLELFICALGIRFYLRAVKFKNKRGRLGFIGLLVVLGLIWLGNLFGPPPPSVLAIALTGNAQWLFIVWAYWLDRQTVYRSA